MNNTHLPKPIQSALNKIAHSRALVRQMEERERLSKEIDRLLANGMTPADALESIRNNPPFVSPA